MKVITIKAPYAPMIALGFKKWETRRTKLLHKLVGQRIAIHCGLDLRELEDIRHGLTAVPINDKSVEIERALNLEGLSLNGDWESWKGHIVATVLVKSWHMIQSWEVPHHTKLERACGYWYAGYYAYELTDVQLLSTPVPARGNVMLWEWATEVEVTP